MEAKWVHTNLEMDQVKAAVSINQNQISDLQ